MIFWGAALAVLVLGGVTLQILGPPKPVPVAAMAPPPSMPAAQLVPPPAPKPPPSESVLPGPAPLPLLVNTSIPEPVQSLLEAAPAVPDALLPRVAADGRTPSQFYAASFSATERHPRVALIIAGIGLDGSASEQAMQSLPASIDFAFSAYAPSGAASALATEGRKRGRECLVSLPMEPAGYPLNEEGNRALLTGASAEVNREHLQEALGHVQGCVGVTGASDGMAGERFAEMRQAFSDTLLEISQRGLLYVDPRPGAPAPAGAGRGAALPLVADIVVDEATSAIDPASAETIDARLAMLEKRALEHGSAIGIAGPPKPVLLERLAVWANGLAARGLVLAPVSAIKPPSMGP